MFRSGAICKARFGRDQSTPWPNVWRFVPMGNPNSTLAPAPMLQSRRSSFPVTAHSEETRLALCELIASDRYPSRISICSTAGRASEGIEECAVSIAAEFAWEPTGYRRPDTIAIMATPWPRPYRRGHNGLGLRGSRCPCSAAKYPHSGGRQRRPRSSARY